MLRQILRNNRWYYLANEFPVADTDSVVFTINFRCGYRKVLCTSRTVTWRRGRERATQREKRRRREIRCLGATKHVLRRDVYIHSPVARTFFCAQRAHCVLRTLLMRVTYTHGSRVPKRFFAHVSHLSISPSPVSCLTHPCCSLTVTSRPFLTLTFTRSCRTYLSYKRRACASPHEDEKFGYLAKSALNTRRERTWLAWSRSGVRGAAMRDRSFHHGGSRARTISESKHVFCFVFVCVSLRVSVSVFPCLCLCLCLCLSLCECLWFVSVFLLRLHHWQVVKHA